MRKLWKLIDPVTFAAAITIVLLVALALFAGQVAPYDPTLIIEGGLTETGMPRPPSLRFPLGTDLLGRDVLSRVIYGARVSLTVGFFAVATSASVGTVIGLVCGYVGGRLDNLVMRFTDIVMSFPSLLLIMAIVATRGPSLTIIFLAIGLVDWPTTARVVRGEVLSLRQVNFVEAATAAGASHWRVARRHLLPNVLGSVIVLATTGIAEAILVEASLSFLGFGVRPPLPTWGGLVSEGFRYIITAPWLSLFPGLAIMVTVVCFNIVGEWLRDRFDPRRRLPVGG